MAIFCNRNGEIEEESKVCISPNNRSFRYGDGCFETMKFRAGKIILGDFHFDRLFNSLSILGFTIPSFFTSDYINRKVLELVTLNGHAHHARVRLVAYRGDGNLYDLDNNGVNFIIQSSLGEDNCDHLNETGLNVGISYDTKITADHYSRIKSNNYLRHAMAAMMARQQGLDGCFLVNAFDRIADSTIANVFIVVDGIIKTPSLSEGSVDGVMRRFLLHIFEKYSLPYAETAVSVQELLSASEVFLTNAIFGIRWVKKIEDKEFTNLTSAKIYNQFIATLFNPSTF